MRIFSVTILCCLVLSSRAQSFTWWENVVHWDGITPWERYIKFAPAYLGPNALPAPRIGNGSIDSVNSIALTGNFHFSKEDKTQNFTLYVNYCLVRNKISFDIFWVPVEHFRTSHHLKEERHVFSHYYYDKYATGDVHLNTNIQLLNREAKGIQSALRIGCRFPSSTGLGAARFTDAPGYWFDISFGKTFGSAPSLKWITMLGGYFWHADNIERHRQNDAFLFGTGLEWNKNGYRIQSYISGYLGYMKNSGDKPIVFRTHVEKKLKRSSFLLGFQQGLHDFKYSSVEMGLKYLFRTN